MCVYAKDSCAALAIGEDPVTQQEWSTATADIVQMARKQALQKNGGGRIAVSGCSSSLQVGPLPLSPQRLAQ
jgi:hypothetical protein